MSSFDTKKMEDAASRLTTVLKKFPDLPKTFSRIPSQISRTVQDIRETADRLKPVESAEGSSLEDQRKLLMEVTRLCQDIKSSVDKLNSCRVDDPEHDTTQKLSEITLVRDPLRVLDSEAESARKKSIVEQELLAQIRKDQEQSSSAGTAASAATSQTLQTPGPPQPAAAADASGMAASKLREICASASAELRKLDHEMNKAILQIQSGWRETAAVIEEISRAFEEQNAAKCRECIERFDGHVTVLRTDATKFETRRAALAGLVEQQERKLEELVSEFDGDSTGRREVLQALTKSLAQLRIRFGNAGIASSLKAILGDVERTGPFVRFHRELDSLRKSLAKNSQLTDLETKKLDELQNLKTAAETFAGRCESDLSFSGQLAEWLTTTEAL